MGNQNKLLEKQFLEHIHIFPSFHHLFYYFKMNGMRRSCVGLVCQNNLRRVSKIRCIVETSVPVSSFHNLTFNKITSQKGQFGIFDSAVPRLNNYGVRKLHIKIEPSEVVRSIAVTEDVTIEKLGLNNKEEALKLSPDETVTVINNEILNIFRVSSKDEIAAMETKDILAKLDAVFKVRVDGQPHVDYPAWLLPMLELPDLKMLEVSRKAWMDRSPAKGWIVFQGYFNKLNRLKKEGDI